jgi:hemerythrin
MGTLSPLRYCARSKARRRLAATLARLVNREDAMTVLAWSEALAVGHEEMDATHEEFVALLNAVAIAEGVAIVPALDRFIAHTEAHFAREEAWMEQYAFPRSGCHRTEHHNVLEVVREVRARVEEGNVHYAYTLAEALAEWFTVHASSMDAMLAIFMQHGADALPECSHEGSESCPNSGKGATEPSSA